MASAHSDATVVNWIESKFCQIESNLLSAESPSSTHVESWASEIHPACERSSPNIWKSCLKDGQPCNPGKLEKGPLKCVLLFLAISWTNWMCLWLGIPGTHSITYHYKVGNLGHIPLGYPVANRRPTTNRRPVECVWAAHGSPAGGQKAPGSKARVCSGCVWYDNVYQRLPQKSANR